jgi:hypothetical protein
MRRGRLLLVLSNLALFAGWLHQLRPYGNTWSDGH